MKQITKTPMEARYFVDAKGAFLGAFTGLSLRITEMDDEGKKLSEETRVEMPALPPEAIEVPEAPEDGRQVWDIKAKRWGPKPASPAVADQTIEQIRANKIMSALIAELAERFGESPEALYAAVANRVSK